MRKLTVLAVSTFTAMSFAACAAMSQPPSAEVGAVAPDDLGAVEAIGPEDEAAPAEAVEGASTEVAELSEEDRNADPFPPGLHAGLTKQVCTECHPARLMLDIRYTQEEAEDYYFNMVSEDLESEQAQKIIYYLTTTLGVEF